MKGRNKILVIIVISVIFLSGCASIISKSMYPVTINSSPEEATITIIDENGLEMYKGKTPATISLSSGESYFHAKRYTVKFFKQGYEEQTTVIKADIDGWYFGNILVGGIIGMLIVDPITGAMWSLPKSVTVQLAEHEKVASSKTERKLDIVSIDKVPECHRKDLVKIS